MFIDHHVFRFLNTWREFIFEYRINFIITTSNFSFNTCDFASLTSLLVTEAKFYFHLVFNAVFLLLYFFF